MTTTSKVSGSVYETCINLFDAYPDAIERTGSKIRAMTLILNTRGEARVYILTHVSGEQPLCSLQMWPGSTRTKIEPGTAAIQPEDNRVLSEGVPLPRDGRLYGYVVDKEVTTLIAFYTNDDPPGVSTIPRLGIDNTRWAPFTRDRVAGHSFWDLYHAGRIIDLGPLISAHPRTVFWVDTIKMLGCGVTAVARDIAGRDGIVLPAGVYVYYKVQQDGIAVPSLETLLADPGRTDLAPRFPSQPRGQQ